MLPVGVAIDPNSGAVSPSTGRYVKHLSELRGIYQDTQALEGILAARGDVAAYEVIEFRQEGSDGNHGTQISGRASGKAGAIGRRRDRV